MKRTDDYQAKIKMWAGKREVTPLPTMIIPLKTAPRKFNSYAEFNRWKSEFIKRIAAAGGVRWTRS